MKTHITCTIRFADPTQASLSADETHATFGKADTTRRRPIRLDAAVLMPGGRLWSAPAGDHPRTRT